MKTVRLYTATAAAFLGLACVSPTFGAPSDALHQRTFTGDIVSVNASDNSLSVKGFFFTRNFTMGKGCNVSLQDKPVAALGDLRPGERVDIAYDDDQGVLIAEHIVQRDWMYSGRITAIDPQARKLSIKDGWMTHELTIGPDCAVTMRDNKGGGLNNLHVGDCAQVVYTPVSGSHMATRITENSALFTGTIQAVDATTRSVKVESAAHNEKKFRLADDCPIVLSGTAHGNLSDLRIGEQVSLTYNDKDGVLVADRISPGMAPVESSPTANTIPASYNGY